MNRIILIIFILNHSVWSQTQIKTQNLVGKFKFINTVRVKVADYNDFFIFSYKGKQLALPIKFKNTAQRTKAKNSVLSTFVIAATIQDQVIPLDGQTKTVKILQVKKMKKIDLKDFGVAS